MTHTIQADRHVGVVDWTVQRCSPVGDVAGVTVSRSSGFSAFSAVSIALHFYDSDSPGEAISTVAFPVDVA